MNATTDTALLVLHDAVRYIRMTHKVWRRPDIRTLPAADIVAIAILEQAAREVLGVRSTQ